MANQQGDKLAIARLERRLAKAAQSLTPKAMRALGEEVAAELEAGNTHDRARGVDRYGRPVKPIKPITQESRDLLGRGRGPRLNPGPARDPRLSRTISTFYTRIETAQRFRVTWGWRGIGKWLRYHIEGLGQVKTDISGPSPRTAKRIGQRIKAYVARTVGGKP